jgi:hypothetical protein
VPCQETNAVPLTGWTLRASVGSLFSGVEAGHAELARKLSTPADGLPTNGNLAPKNNTACAALDFPQRSSPSNPSAIPFFF